ncbi:hypothetical protein RRG08_025527 [Elysia crispata]|uniref:Uncharacterized protein n=1 Tax=Elysia crispata TaxID=231223 RepID=A0AAE1A0X7_9GAST|nr:hypothetical protein RRG08_025527 [Elysia crispata]
MWRYNKPGRDKKFSYIYHVAGIIHPLPIQRPIGIFDPLDLQLSFLCSGSGEREGSRHTHRKIRSHRSLARDFLPHDRLLSSKTDITLTMNPACSSIVRLSLLVCVACLLPRSSASPLDTIEGPVEPVIALNQMAPDHACLFICTMCFPDMKDVEHMMDCSNKVCGPVAEGRCAMEKFIWLGHHCKGYKMVESMWSATGFH